MRLDFVLGVLEKGRNIFAENCSHEAAAESCFYQTGARDERKKQLWLSDVKRSERTESKWRQGGKGVSSEVEEDGGGGRGGKRSSWGPQQGLRDPHQRCSVPEAEGTSGASPSSKQAG